mgnify:FL=1
MNRKVVLITGSSRGIGRSTAIKYAQNNYNVVINYNNSYDKARELGDYLVSTYGIEVMIVKADVGNEVEVKDMVDKVISKFGDIDVLVNNASIAIDSDFTCKDSNSFNEILNTNLVGTFLVSKEVSKYMKDNRSGIIINVSSTNGIDSMYVESLEYDASKAGVISLTHNLAEYLKPYVRVNCVCPGWVNTDMNKDLDSAYIEQENKRIMLNRFAEPEEIANVIYFLATDEASYINNSIIKVDGGRVN